MNGCLFTGMMSVLLASNDNVYMVEGETEDLVEVILESFAFSYASYIIFVNMTASILCSN